MGDVLRGNIKRLVKDRGFGFIKTSDGREFFFHTSGVRGSGFDRLTEGQAVTFEVEASNKGPRAAAVEAA